MSTPAVLLQKAIVEAVQVAPQYNFRDLVFLCWKYTKKFDFAKANEAGLRLVLDAVKRGEEVPRLLREIEEQICSQRRSCECLWGHVPTCRVHKFRAAIEQ